MTLTRADVMDLAVSLLALGPGSLPYQAWLIEQAAAFNYRWPALKHLLAWLAGFL